MQLTKMSPARTGNYYHETVGAVPSVLLDATTVVNTDDTLTSLTTLTNHLVLFTTSSGTLRQVAHKTTSLPSYNNII